MAKRRSRINSDADARARWRLILGADAKDAEGRSLAELAGEHADIDRVLEFLFDRELELDADTYRERLADRGESRLSAPDWLGRVRRLFPKSTAEQLARVALDRYGLVELLADERLLETVEPNLDLLRAVLACKDLLPTHVLAAAKRIVRKVVEELRDRLSVKVRQRFSGVLDRRRRSPIAVAKNFDAKTTIQRNLKHYQKDREAILIERAYFFSRIHRQSPWDLILLVDQSGSMLDSVIHSAVLAGIFRSLPMLRTRLVLFDTSVVDVTEEAADPVETLMRVQLAGGTDIAQALRYADQWVRNPRRTIVTLVTDFFEGALEADLFRITAKLTESGVTVLGLAALDDRAEPAYHRGVAERMARLGVHVAAMTPDRLAEWVAEKVRS